jgi:hypothetical protein
LMFCILRILKDGIFDLASHTIFMEFKNLKLYFRLLNS